MCFGGGGSKEKKPVTTSTARADPEWGVNGDPARRPIPQVEEPATNSITGETRVTVLGAGGKQKPGMTA